MFVYKVKVAKLATFKNLYTKLLSMEKKRKVIVYIGKDGTMKGFTNAKLAHDYLKIIYPGCVKYSRFIELIAKNSTYFFHLGTFYRIYLNEKTS